MPGWRAFRATRRTASSTARSARQLVGAKIHELSIRLADPAQPVRQLSGGNQQKVVLAKWLLVENIQLFIFDEPTRGVDIATKVEIYQMIRDLADSGVAVLLISSEMPEVLGMADRLLVVRDGRIVAEFAREAFRPETVFAHAAGLACPGRGRSVCIDRDRAPRRRSRGRRCLSASAAPTCCSRRRSCCWSSSLR